MYHTGVKANQTPARPMGWVWGHHGWERRAYLAWVEEEGIFIMDGRGGHIHHRWKRRAYLAWVGEENIFFMGGREGHIYHGWERRAHLAGALGAN